MSLPLISVIVPYRNIAEYFGECVTSIRQQTFKDWELLLTDDASSDSSTKVALDAMSGDLRLWYHARNVKRESALPNLMRMIQCARGSIVAFVGGDDVLTPDALERVAREYDDPSCMATHGSYRIYPDGPRGHARPAHPNERFYDCWYFASLLTWKRHLSIESMQNEPEQYRDPDTGSPYRSAADLAIYWPIAHRTEPRYIDDIIYLYRQWGPTEDGRGNDAVVDIRAQNQAAAKIRAYWKRRYNDETP